MKNLIDIFFRPGRCAAGIAERPRILLPGGAVLALSVILFAAGYADAAAAAAARIPFSATPAERAAAEGALRGEFLRNLSILPLRLAFGWVLFAAGLSLSARIFCAPRGVRFAHFLSLTLHAEAILLLGAIPPLFGVSLPDLSLIAGAGGAFQGALLASINLTTLWHVLALSAGISVLCGSRIHTAALAAGVVWAAALAMNAGILSLLSRGYSFP